MKQSAHMAPARPLLRRRRPLKQSQPFSRRIQRDYKQIWVLLREGAQEIGLSFSDNKAKYIGRNLYSLGGMEFKMLVLRKQGSSTSHWKEQSQPFKHYNTSNQSFEFLNMIMMLLWFKIRDNALIEVEPNASEIWEVRLTCLENFRKGKVGALHTILIRYPVKSITNCNF